MEDLETDHQPTFTAIASIGGHPQCHMQLGGLRENAQEINGNSRILKMEIPTIHKAYVRAM